MAILSEVCRTNGTRAMLVRVFEQAPAIDSTGQTDPSNVVLAAVAPVSKLLVSRSRLVRRKRKRFLYPFSLDSTEKSKSSSTLMLIM